MRSRALVLLVLGALAPLAPAACSPSADQGTIQILTVDDPFVGPPAAATITVQAVDYDDGGADGTVTTLARGPASPGSINLGTYDETDTESLLVTATDSYGSLVARGETLPIQLGAVAGLTLGVFVQRTGTLSRMPSPLGDGREAPVLNIVGGRYVFVSGGADSSLGTQTRLYDLIAWAPLGAPPSLSFAPESVVIAQPTEGDFQALAISGSSGAAWYDLTSASTDDASAPPATEQWADVAGGATITATDSSVSFVVGGTRTQASGYPPTSAVLIVSANGTLSWATLSTPRLGATAAWVDGLGGLVVEGGNQPGAETAPGAEIVYPSSTTTPIALPLPPDTTAGAGMTALDDSHVLIVGGGSASGAVGGNAVRVLTVPCGTTAPCQPTPWSVTLPTALTFAQAFTLDSSTVFVVGEDPSGTTHAYTLTASTAIEVPFRVPRTHARAVRLPIGPAGTGPIAVVGGQPDAGANTSYIESFVP